MDFKKLFKHNDKAVSPVIGVILMVAITVILAAAIGSSVFNQTNPIQTTSKADIDVKALAIGSSETVAYINIEHLGGDSLDFGTITGTATPAKAKITASLTGANSKTIYTKDLGVFSAGDVKKVALAEAAAEATPIDTIANIKGKTVNIKITNLETNQVVCDRNVKF
jgi:archaeal type IV pilus assembly protein PilA